MAGGGGASGSMAGGDGASGSMAGGGGVSGAMTGRRRRGQLAGGIAERGRRERSTGFVRSHGSLPEFGRCFGKLVCLGLRSK